MSAMRALLGGVLAASAGISCARDDAPHNAAWQALVSAAWSVPPGGEKFVCALATVRSDAHIAALRTIAPPGTHHSLLTVTEPVAPDGTFECDGGTLSDAMLFASGIATNDLRLPPEAALHVPAGKQILLNLHLLNTTATPLEGRTAVEMRAAAPDASVAEMVFAGTVDIAIPPGVDHAASGSCTFDEDATLFDLWPHMHRLGTRMTIVHRASSGAATVLHDAPYDVREQRHYSIVPRLVRRGERVEVTCHWKNTSTAPVTYGDSSADEMCFAGLYRYPAARSGIYCGTDEP
jgi:hypothetical protein